MVTDVLEPQVRGDALQHPECKMNTHSRVIDALDYVPSTSHASSQHASLFVFEGHGAVIKMTIHGRSPTLGRVSRTFRVDIGWLFFYLINLDPGIPIKIC